MERYTFTNWTNEPFTGRFGGTPYEFAPQETKEFDSDKHYMLIVLSKQLADREILKGIRGVGRDPSNQETFGKSLDINGQIYSPGPEARKEFMRKAIGVLVDTPVPTPEQPTEEAGATAETKEDIQGLKDQIQQLTELVQSLAGKVGEAKMPPATVPATSTPVSEKPLAPVVPIAEPSERPAVGRADIGMTRELLISMCEDEGITYPENATKEELIDLLNTSH